MEGFLTLLPDGISIFVLTVLVASSLATSFTTAAFGIGGGGLLLAIMATLVPVSALIPVHGVVQLGSNAGRMTLFAREISWPAIPAFAAGSLLGCLSGGLVVVELPASIIQMGIGFFVIWNVFARPPLWLREWPLVAGAVSSFLTMFFGATGLFVATFTKSRNLPRHAHVATQATLMTIQHALKVITFAVLGFSFAEWWCVILLMVSAGGAGTWIGKQILNRLSDHWFKLALDFLLVLISVRLIWAGATDLF